MEIDVLGMQTAFVHNTGSPLASVLFSSHRLAYLVALEETHPLVYPLKCCH